MAPTYQRKEDFDKKSQAWIAAASRAWGIPEDELWEEVFSVELPTDNQTPTESLLAFPLPPTQ